jgi:hypothetical protein
MAAVRSGRLGRRPRCRGGVSSISDVSRLIAILSPERSGSTLLSMMLGGHGRIVAPPEMHLLVYETFDAWRSGYPEALDSLSFAMEALGLPHAPEEIERRFRGLPTERVYDVLLERCNEGSVWLVDKTPRYAKKDSSLRRVESLEPLLIWLIRHPLGVAASKISARRAARRARRGSGWTPRLKHALDLLRERRGRREAVAREVAYWVEAHGRIEALLAEVPESRQLTVHYEDLVSDPERVMRNVCAALGIEFEARMLEPWQNLPDGLRPYLGDWKIRERRSIEVGRADDWRRRYGEDLLDASVLQRMERYGVAR